ncbi:hypothetical protein I7I51_07497 [Histoplasma capsulatum]|uniref:Uncharacterized protein n=1 Tax=Ajellomyces capsulatus TaxID=5037 RepID=A0A8A1LXX9_AJECA|nr:hypothetical protein I7I51_07497 [Histoplasma capsulatum]
MPPPKVLKGPPLPMISNMVHPRVQIDGGMQGRTELCFDVGESARAIKNYKPDNAYFDIHVVPHMKRMGATYSYYVRHTTSEFYAMVITKLISELIDPTLIP